MFIFCVFWSDTVPSAAPKSQRPPDTPLLRRERYIGLPNDQADSYKESPYTPLVCILEVGTCHPCQGIGKGQAVPTRPGLESSRPPRNSALSCRDKLKYWQFLFLRETCYTSDSSSHIGSNRIRQTVLQGALQLLYSATHPSVQSFICPNSFLHLSCFCVGYKFAWKQPSSAIVAENSAL